MITTQRELRKQFWAAHPTLSRKRIPSHDGRSTMYVTDTRCAFADWINELYKTGQISEALADRATLD